MEAFGYEKRAGKQYKVDTGIERLDVGQMKRYLKVAAALLAAVLCVQQALPVKAWDGMITISVLGDSIAKGYSSDKVNKITCYGRIVTERLAEENETYFNYTNYAKNGLNTQEMNEQILSRDTVKRSLNQSDFILLTMGSNDLLDEFKREAQEILDSDTKFRSANQALNELTEGVKKNPLTILKIVDALSNWDHASFENEWMKAMETIIQQKKDNARIVVTNIYNPVYNMDLPGTLNKVVENIINNMNSIIEKRAGEYGYEVVDLFHSNIVAFVQGDGLHPNQEGQNLIADLVYKKLEIALQEEELQSVEGDAIKGEDAEENSTGGNTAPDNASEKPPEQPSQQNHVEEPQSIHDNNGSSRVGVEVLLGGLLVFVIAAVFIGFYVKRKKTGKK